MMLMGLESMDRGIRLLEGQMMVDMDKSNIIHLTTFGKSAGLTGAMICGQKNYRLL